MATGNFRIKTKRDWNSINYRFKHGSSFDIEISIGIQIPNLRWSEKKQEVLQTGEIDYREVNSKLKEYSNFISKEYNQYCISNDNIVINSKWLKEKTDLFFGRVSINEDLNKKLYLTNFIESFIEDSKTKTNRNNKPVAHRTIQHYQTCLNKIHSFENHIGRKLKIKDFGIKIHNEFIEFLKKQEKLNSNTIGGYIDDIKQFIASAERKSLEVNLEYKSKDFYSPSNSTNDIYLTEDEINIIFNHKYEKDYLDNARDWFIIGLRTGLRISDFLKLTTKNLVDGFIEKKTIKTAFPVIIPLHPQVKQILNKRNGKFPRTISDQNFNTYIKELCQNVGFNEEVYGAKMCPTLSKIDGKNKTVYRKKNGYYPKFELVTSHICRRSFATNLYGKLDTLTIMKITGHKTETQFLSYIKITPRENAERLKELWRKLE
jgi:integrase